MTIAAHVSEEHRAAVIAGSAVERATESYRKVTDNSVVPHFAREI